jgi:hypothetical protein
MANDEKKKIITQTGESGYAKESGSSLREESYLYDLDGKIIEDETGESGSGSFGGQTGEVEFRFHDATQVANRDDLLPPEEIKRLLIVHKETHKARVDKQKITREQRNALKQGVYVAPTVAQQLGRGGSGGSVSPYKKHPISDKAQFSGIDKQVIGIPSLNEADTNPEQKDKLENRLQNRLQNAPKFNPRPRFPG